MPPPSRRHRDFDGDGKRWRSSNVGEAARGVAIHRTAYTVKATAAMVPELQVLWKEKLRRKPSSVEVLLLP